MATKKFITINSLLQLVVEKTAKAVAQKESKKKKIKEDFLFTQLKRHFGSGINATNHFAERIVQRFEEVEKDELSGAISRSIRKVKTLENGCNHKAISQKLLDESTGIVVVLERIGLYGANLITTYKVGQENLLCEEEYKEIKLRGLV